MRLILSLIIVCALGYPVGAMNVRGERIIVFGDSLTQHTGSVPVWDVDQGPQRQSAGPGDLFASMLLDQGAEAVRLNAKGGRSGYNFWTVEPGGQLIANDLAWKPTKIVFVMGTNDVGMTAGPDQAAYQRIYNGYKPSGAEMWVIGPFLNRQDAAQREVVYKTLRNVFGANRVIDGRELTKIIAPGSDGIHYNTTGARALALNMTDAILSASPVRGWLGIAIGAAIVVGGAFVYGLATNPKRGLAGLEIVNGKRWGGSTAELVRGGYRQVPCKSGLDAKGMARCWTGGGHSLKGKEPNFFDIIQDDDPGSMQVAEDFLLDRGWKLREMGGGLQARNFTFAMKPLHGPGAQWKMVQINVTEPDDGHPGRVRTNYTVANGPVRVVIAEHVALSPDDARKSAVATGWAIAKAIKPLPLDTDEDTIRRITREALAKGAGNMIPEELFGLSPRGRKNRGAGLGLTSAQKDTLANVVADFRPTAMRKGWNNYKDPSRSAACDIATQMFIKKADDAGVPLKLFAFDWNNPVDLRRMGQIYKLGRKKLRKLQALVARTPYPDCMFHHVAVTDDGYAIDWTANQFKPSPMPFVYKLDRAA